MEQNEINRLIKSLQPSTVEDEMKLKIINRLEHYAKQLNRTMKAPYIEDIDV